ncbi:glucokinase [Pseudoalteromonas phenolica]|uniref:Glucokinase n=1 Tax=Pseudoalteromonas phenolica TaxID=161398 RepID=A0A4Q7IP55_9GAMM|nr:glucokinase [Pseudoalteromonas phenolica]RZQ53641.1 glucokinase [Pseudoalteromonas phenolica]
MTTQQSESLTRIIADIGGTNIRLAIVDEPADGYYRNISTYKCADYAGLAEVLKLYISEQQLENSRLSACLAIACPVDDDLISMTNLPWQFSQSALKETLKLESLTLINDYTAIAMAIPLLSDAQKVKIGDGEAVAGKPISVCGPGTGLGVANLIPVGDKWHCVSGEGGHVDYAPVGELEIEILRFLNKIKQRVSYEQLLSGYGLEQVYQAVSAIKQNPNTEKLSAQQVSERGLSNDCEYCNLALNVFCRVLGAFAGNLALTCNSVGGVYIAGGIVPRFVDFLKSTAFRERFENKGRLSHIPRQAPTYVITESQPGLLGAAAHAMQS